MNKVLSVIICICVAAVTFEIVMMTVGFKQKAAQATVKTAPAVRGESAGGIVPTEADLQPDDAPQNTPAAARQPSPETQSVQQPSEQAPAPPVSPDDDSVLIQARRELRQAQTDVSIPPADAVTSPDGKIHLKSGGTISAEEWQSAKNRIP